MGEAAPNFSDNALVVLARRYLRKSGATAESPTELLWRVARALAKPESAYGGNESACAARFYAAMASLDFLPNSPTLMNAGTPLGQLSACFVLPVEDSMEQIFDAVKWAATIQKTGGGTGFSFSRIRPAGDSVDSTAGAASGPVSFIDVFNSATHAIRQGGVRRGANMAVLRVDHPDILEFIAAKSNPARLTNFNVSVAITDAFMAALARGERYPLESPRTHAPTGQSLDAKKVWGLIAQMAWLSGEPGVIFIDRVNAANPTPDVGKMEATNPCGELPLLPFESCNLGSINVARFVSSTGDWDYARLQETVWLGVRLLDNVIDANRYPLPQIAAITRRNRKIGLGVMGFADALIMRNIAYDSEAAILAADALMAFIAKEGEAASLALGKERGPFTGWEKSRRGLPLRNATVTTIAPTGTISILAGCSSGIEPLYAVSFVRQVLDGAQLSEVQPLFVERARAGGFYSDALLRDIAVRGSVKDIAAVPADMQKLFVTAYDIAPKWHLQIQAAFQRHVDNAVSKTINFPESASVTDVERVFADAYTHGLKGVTVYRDGSRKEQVLSFGDRGAGALANDLHQCPDCRQALPQATRGTCQICLGCGYSRCL